MFSHVKKSKLHTVLASLKLMNKTRKTIALKWDESYVYLLAHAIDFSYYGNFKQ